MEKDKLYLLFWIECLCLWVMFPNIKWITGALKTAFVKVKWCNFMELQGLAKQSRVLSSKTIIKNKCIQPCHFQANHKVLSFYWSCLSLPVATKGQYVRLNRRKTQGNINKYLWSRSANLWSKYSWLLAADLGFCCLSSWLAVGLTSMIFIRACFLNFAFL